MKRICTLLLILWTTAASVSAQFRYGLSMGVDFSSVGFNKAVLDSKPRQGFFFGPKVKATVPGFGLGFDASIRYCQKYIAIIDDITEDERQIYESDKMNYFQAPVNVRWDMGFHGWGIYLAAGPQFNWFIGNSSWGTGETFFASFKHSTVNINIGAGLWLFNHLNLGVSLSLPLTNEGVYSMTFLEKLHTSLDNLEMKNYSWQINFDFYF